MAKDDYLSAGDEELLDALDSHDTVKGAAESIHIKASSARVRLYDIRKKKVRATNTVNRLNTRGIKNPLVRKLLIPLQRVEPKVETRDE